MIFDYRILENGMVEATGRCIKEDLLKVTGNEEEIKEMVTNKYNQLCQEYYDCNFKRDKVFTDGNIIELRSGEVYKIENDYAIANKKTKYSAFNRLWKNNWDDYGYFGCNACRDIVKIYDSNMVLLSERFDLDPLSTKNFKVN